MSVLKSKRGENELDVVTNSRELAIYTIKICTNENNFPKRYRWCVTNEIVKSTNIIHSNIRRANEVFIKDGTNSLSAIKFTGSSKLIESVYKYIGLKGSIYREKRHKDCLYLQYFGDEMRSLLDYMYDDCNIALKRKHEVYLKHRPLWEDG